MQDTTLENPARGTVLMRFELTTFQSCAATFIRQEDHHLELEVSGGGSSYAAASSLIEGGRFGGEVPLVLLVDSTLLEGAFSVSIIDEAKQAMVFAQPIYGLGRKQHSLRLPSELPARFRLIFSNFQEKRTHFILHDVAIAQSTQFLGVIVNEKAEAAACALQTLMKAVTKFGVFGEKEDPIQIEMALPFSRAAASDYLRLLELWNSHDLLADASLLPRNCPACGSSHHRFLFKSYDNYPYHGCEACGVWFVPLKPDEALFASFWAKAPEAKQVADLMMLQRERGTRNADRERFQHYFDLLAPTLKGCGRVRYLDIGCGVGHSVELAAELGFAAMGVETNETALQTAKAHGRNVVSDLRLADQKCFDLISLFETLEHLVEPDLVITSAVNALAPNGLIIVTVPNRASWEVSLLRQDCFHVYGGTDGVGHINLFHIAGLKRLFQRHGLDVAFADGQFGSDLLRIFATLSAPDLATVMNSEGFVFRFARAPHTILNVIGPAVALLDRLQHRSPILIAVAGRPEALEEHGPALAKMQADRDAQILNQLKSV